MAINVPISGKIGKTAPTAKSGSSSGPDTGPVEDDRASGGSMYDLMPPPHFSASGVARRAKALDAAKQMVEDRAEAAGE